MRQREKENTLSKRPLDSECTIRKHYHFEGAIQDTALYDSDFFTDVAVCNLILPINWGAF